MGTGTSYSLPRTPEDFLSNVDEMDSSDSSTSIIFLSEKLVLIIACMMLLNIY